MQERQTDSGFGGNDGDGEAGAPPWVAEFLATLIVTGSVRESVVEAGIDFETAWALRRAEPAFAMYWDRAVRMHKGIVARLAALDAPATKGGEIIH